MFSTSAVITPSTLSLFRDVQDSLDYVFAHFCGILVTSVFWFTVYVFIKKNEPVVNPRVCVPAMLSGIMWGIAQVI